LKENGKEEKETNRKMAMLALLLVLFVSVFSSLNLANPKVVRNEIDTMIEIKYLEVKEGWDPIAGKSDVFVTAKINKGGSLDDLKKESCMHA